jgi:hypothetical protein
VNTLHLKKNHMPEPTPKKQWSQLIGKNVEVITKVGYVITGWVEVSQAHALTVIDATIKRRDSPEVERQSKPVHIGCENIAIAVEL